MPQLSIQGISHGRFSNFFPISVRGLTMVMGVYSPRNGESFTIEFRHSDGTKAFDFIVKINDIQTYDPAVNEFREVNEVEAAAVKGWVFHTAQIHEAVLVFKPDTLYAILKDGAEEYPLGAFALGHATPSPILARPNRSPENGSASAPYGSP
jgi:hypothetical protein